ncbi:hypothetical protein NIES4106_62000 (plasmid) [Fischerella sp. NIES-4106]|nr:hypothetical protein NIES4106_62000 [Fischerella sp. NIES-4106]
MTPGSIYLYRASKGWKQAIYSHESGSNYFFCSLASGKPIKIQALNLNKKIKSLPPRFKKGDTVLTPWGHVGTVTYIYEGGETLSVHAPGGSFSISSSKVRKYA